MELSELLYILLGEFFQKIDLLQNLVVRDVHFPRSKEVIKVAIGMRRTGKTTFLYQKVRDLLNQEVAQRQILYLNCEDDRLQPLTIQKLSP